MISRATSAEESSITYLSTDEKTGIQALSRVEAPAPTSKGAYQRQEAEYQRNGTTTLIAATDLQTGRICHHVCSATRTEKDYAQFIEQAVTNALAQEGTQEVVVMADQLNTHLSESLVKLIVVLGVLGEIELGKKGTEGILKNKTSRKKFLEDPTHKVRFLFTPKHCSWLNPIENWFAKLQKQLIAKGNFASVEILQQKIDNYIKYYNNHLAKPINWQFKGFDKQVKLHNIIMETT